MAWGIAKISFSFLGLDIYFCYYEGMCMKAQEVGHVCGGQKTSLQSEVLSFHVYMDSRNLTQVVRLISNHIY